jgi:hypothetical protein
MIYPAREILEILARLVPDEQGGKTLGAADVERLTELATAARNKLDAAHAIVSLCGPWQRGTAYISRGFVEAWNEHAKVLQDHRPPCKIGGDS